MTTVKITALPALTATNSVDADLVPIVSSFSGTPTTYKITLAELRVQLNDGAQTFSGALTVAGVTIVNNTIRVNGTTACAVELNTTTGATSDTIQLYFSRNNAIKWRLGQNVGGGNADAFDLWNETVGGLAVRINNATSAATFSGALTVSAGGITVSAGGAAVTGNSTVTGTLGVSGVLTASTGLTVTAGGVTISSGGLNVNTATVCTVGTLNATSLSSSGGVLVTGGAITVPALSPTGATGNFSSGAADSGGAGFRMLRVPN